MQGVEGYEDRAVKRLRDVLEEVHPVGKADAWDCGGGRRDCHIVPGGPGEEPRGHEGEVGVEDCCVGACFEVEEDFFFEGGGCGVDDREGGVAVGGEDNVVKVGSGAGAVSEVEEDLLVFADLKRFDRSPQMYLIFRESDHHSVNVLFRAAHERHPRRSCRNRGK